MVLSRQWAMPNSNTFSIKPINELLHRYGFSDELSVLVDPFCRNSLFNSYCITNDIDPDVDADYHMDALQFLKTFENASVNGVLFDPPYSPRQVSEVYRKLDMSVNMQTTQSSFWGNLKKEIARILIPTGICVTCGWNSGGVGKGLGMQIEEILLVPHGGWHNDTIVTVERKL